MGKITPRNRPVVAGVTHVPSPIREQVNYNDFVRADPERSSARHSSRSSKRSASRKKSSSSTKKKSASESTKKKSSTATAKKKKKPADADD
jgi:hypothetical protein